MASVPLFALFVKIIKQAFERLFLLHKITLLSLLFFYGFDEFFINLKAQNQSILSKKPF